MIKENEIVFFKQYLSKADKILEITNNSKIKVINYFEEQFPKQLKTIPNSPIQLFIKGNIDSLNNFEKSIAVIGTRNPTEISKKIVFEIAEKFSNKDYVIVSGLAKGCDTAAHKGCLKNNGSTVAVLAHGLHDIFPKSNLELSEKIIVSGGCLVSEYYHGKDPEDYFFIERDRIQSGLSSSIVLVESEIDGGSMHTINFAKAQNRNIYAMRPVGNSNSFLGNKKVIDDKIAIEFQNTQHLTKIFD
jgi:DNA processing protein